MSANIPIKITSIAALLNYSPPTSPTYSTTSFPPHHHHNQQLVRVKEEEDPAKGLLVVKEEPPPPDLLHKMNCGELGIAIDTTYHPLYSRKAAKLSAGGLIELADAVVQGELKNGFALIRPPGHHAEDDQAMGYCFYNNVAVAVSAIMEKYPEKIQKVLIIDW